MVPRVQVPRVQHFCTAGMDYVLATHSRSISVVQHVRPLFTYRTNECALHTDRSRSGTVASAATTVGSSPASTSERSSELPHVTGAFPYNP